MRVSIGRRYILCTDDVYNGLFATVVSKDGFGANYWYWVSVENSKELIYAFKHELIPIPKRATKNQVEALRALLCLKKRL